MPEKIQKKYKIHIIRGSLRNPNTLNNLGAKPIKKFKRQEWQSLDEVTVTLEQIKKLQKEMVRHYDDEKIPWYLDGYNINNKNDLIVAFGADDGEGGKIFQFSRYDKAALKKIIKYGKEKGIPEKELIFDDN